MSLAAPTTFYDPIAREVAGYRYDRAFTHYLRDGAAALSSGERRLLEEVRDQSVGTNSAGGFTVAPGFLDKLTIGLKRGSAMFRVANVIPTDTGAPTSWPSVDDTGNTGAILAENTQAPPQDITFGSKSLSAYMYSSKRVVASMQLVQDSAKPLDDWLPRLLARRIARAANAHFTNGTGGGAQPVGLVPNATSALTLPTGNTTSYTYSGLVDLIRSVDPEYTEPFDEPGNAGDFIGFMTSTAGLDALREVKDTAGLPIVTFGNPTTVLGYRVAINNDMPVPAANAKSILFGNFTAGYVIRQARGATTVLRLVERYADALQVGWLAFASLDGVPDDANAVRALTHSAT